MGKKTSKFYKPGTLMEKGTKISLKTQPYINGIIFNTQDPISSFHSQLAIIKLIINEYEYIKNIPGMQAILQDALGDIPSVEIGKSKLLIDYLIGSPIEITLKDQVITQNILNDLQVPVRDNDE